MIWPSCHKLTGHSFSLLQREAALEIGKRSKSKSRVLRNQRGRQTLAPAQAPNRSSCFLLALLRPISFAFQWLLAFFTPV